VLGRVRAATPRSQTRCAGVALFNGCESAHALIARADAALYEAKALGRSRTVTAGGDQARRADGCGEEGRGS
jgi:predicted signal transduction protein with EAL and GGDEF domain